MNVSDETRRIAESLSVGLRGFMITIRKGADALPATRQQLEVLGALSDGPRRVSDLAEDAGVRMPTMTTQLARLERDGLVARTRGSSDARVVMISLTKEGQKIIGKGAELWSTMLNKKIERLDAEERRALETAAPILQKLFPLPASLREAAGPAKAEQAVR